jgi:hypothetical protein
MSGTKRRMIHQQEDESDKEFDNFMTAMMGEYRKRKHERRRRHRGSVFGHKVYDRSREEHDIKLYRDYFVENPVYPAKYFQRRFRMSRPLFNRMAAAVRQNDPYFV